MVGSGRARPLAALSAATLLATFVAAPASAQAAPATAAKAPDWTFPANQTALTDVARIIRADGAYALGITGKGVGVALIDTGVAPVVGLTSGNVANGPDLSLESQVPSLLYKDGYGHGTHMAGIIAGRDTAAGTGFRGVAPDAKLTSIKVGMSNGAVDVSQMLAAIDWVVEHRNDDKANPIRVLNLSYGTDSLLDYHVNPLTVAVQNAWNAGIVVVVASGNTGRQITSPANDVRAIRVGATDSLGTTDRADDVISSFTSRDGADPTILAPGRSISSLRVPGSYADTLYPTARVGDRYFKGSGTSQAAAVVSGAVALFLQKYPKATPWQVRQALRNGGYFLPSANPRDGGGLQLDVTGALAYGAGSSPGPDSVGMSNDALLQATRGSSIVSLGPSNTPLVGERDIFGPFSTAAWSKASAAGTSWQGGAWMGHAWAGDTWTTASDGQQNWAGRAWPGTSWSGRAWSDVAWAGRAWSGRGWSDISWAGRAWSGSGWTGASWE
jgi:serine protease AprX